MQRLVPGTYTTGSPEYSRTHRETCRLRERIQVGTARALSHVRSRLEEPLVDLDKKLQERHVLGSLHTMLCSFVSAYLILRESRSRNRVQSWVRGISFSNVGEVGLFSCMLLA